MPMFDIPHGFQKFSNESICTYTTHTGLRGHTYSSHQHKCYTPVVNKLSALVLSHFGINCRPRQLVHRRRNPSRHFWTPTFCSCSQKYTSNSTSQLVTVLNSLSFKCYTTLRRWRRLSDPSIRTHGLCH